MSASPAASELLAFSHLTPSAPIVVEAVDHSSDSTSNWYCSSPGRSTCGRRSAVSDQHTAIGNQHTAIGNQHTAIGNQHTAIGNQHTAISNQHTAIGNQQSAISNQHLLEELAAQLDSIDSDDQIADAQASILLGQRSREDPDDRVPFVHVDAQPLRTPPHHHSTPDLPNDGSGC